ncbi:MAG: P-loop containing nucleoside triphosphate hydrolase protein [Benjaminiella poitrasii]|nr:MAG: P-loop containing nucleoside triphosphate hydrolase protein [Benjaminiella poitrasii]
MVKNIIRNIFSKSNVLPVQPKVLLEQNEANSSTKRTNSASKKPKMSIFQLFRFATTKERIMIFLAAIFSAGSGSLPPFALLIYGSFLSTVTIDMSDKHSFLDAISSIVLKMIYTGTSSMIAGYVSNCLWVITGESQARRIRSLYLNAMLNQDMSWFDELKDDDLATRLATDTQIIQDGISEKFGLFISFTAQFISGFIVAFSKGYKMALVMISVLPILTIIIVTLIVLVRRVVVLTLKANASAGSVAEQALNSIRTIYSFSLQERFSIRYEDKLQLARQLGIKKGAISSFGTSAFMVVFYGSFGLALWYGSRLAVEKSLPSSSVYIVFLGMITGSMSLTRIVPNLLAIINACSASYNVFKAIDHVPEIKTDNDQGERPSKIYGTIELKNVTFAYPTRHTVKTLDDMSLKITPGTTVAFVGPSGSGKSTIVQLIQRFYDPNEGEILLDGHRLKDLNVKWLRKNIGVVGQQPVLFNMSIRQNLMLGSHEQVKEADMINACKEANCHRFITQLPQGYDTLVGEQGGILSGGQRQRIAIARSILKNPSILLLDEATSALDTQSERLVQDALDKASASRTTIVVAHRLSTIAKADMIIVMDQGRIIEKGSHQELLLLNGKYASLVKKQEIEVERVESSAEKSEKNSNNDNSEYLLYKEEQDIKKRISGSHLFNMEKAKKSASRFSILEEMITVNSDVYEKGAQLGIIDDNADSSEKIKQVSTWQIVQRMRPEWKFLAIGMAGSCLQGCALPLYAYTFSSVISILFEPVLVSPKPFEGTNMYAFMIVIVGIGSAIGYVLGNLCFLWAGENFTCRLRGQVFATYMKQEMGFFDQEENSIGALTSQLNTDARNVSEMVTSVWSDVIQLCATLTTGLTIAFVFSWQLTLVIFGMAPFIMMATSYETFLQKGFVDRTKKANARSNQIASEAIREVRTVAGLNQQVFFEERYFEATEYPHRLAIRKAYFSSIGSGFYRGITIYTNALAFYAGARFIINGHIDFRQLITSMTVLITTCETAGRSSMFAAAYEKGKHATMNIFHLFERQPKIDTILEGYEPTSIQGEVDFSNIKFVYPARPETVIFDGQFNLNGRPGQTIALVGPSGCGKSTAIGLLQRWYDPANGKVSIDQKDVKSYSVDNLRSHMAVVGQEPILFDMSIEENIKLGVIDETKINREDIENAARAANIHSFIVELPQGYNTRVGFKGSQLSGGQKQRIAIARALLRKPKILLLDEATSALDSESERLVQEALDSILQEGERTTIMIAHRLSTITHADLICVVKDKKIIERGTHWELLDMKGAYSKLVSEQSLSIS